jgi:hypothetical protein
MMHQFSRAEPKGQRTCPKCKAGITGAATTGKCSDLQQRDTSTPGNNPRCDHVFTKKMTKDKKRIQELEAQLATCGGGARQAYSGGSGVPLDPQIRAENARLKADNARLMADNARLMAENATLSSIQDDDGIFGAPSLSRIPSLTDISPRDDSLGAAAADDNSDIGDLLGLLDDPVPPTSSEADLRQENARLKAELDTVRSTLQKLLQRMS